MAFSGIFMKIIIKQDRFFREERRFLFHLRNTQFSLYTFWNVDEIYWLQAIGFGVMIYGFAYFMVHDVIIHQRFKWFTRSKSTYVRAIRWAHKMHHRHLNKQEGESFVCYMYIKSIGKK
jgi:beta-carotene 3-hydroxylase